MSKEHIISHGVLKALSDDGKVKIRGLSWQNNDETVEKFPAKRLVSKVLCERHNNALAPLDAVALRFFNSFDQIDKEFAEKIQKLKDRVHLFNGHDIERWILKTLCGLVFSGSASSQSGKIKGWTPNIKWLRVLFGQESFPRHWGLYFAGRIGETTTINRDIAFNTLSNNVAGVYGLIFTLKTKKFILAMGSPPKDKTGTILEHGIYRPGELVMTDGHSKKVVQFGWDIKGDGRGVIISYENKNC